MNCLDGNLTEIDIKAFIPPKKGLLVRSTAVNCPPSLMVKLRKTILSVAYLVKGDTDGRSK
jgi:hypothetical protein